MCILLLWGEMFYKYQLSPFDLECYSIVQYFHDFFVWEIHALLTVGFKNMYNDTKEPFNTYRNFHAQTLVFNS